MKKLVFLLCALAVMPAFSAGRSGAGNTGAASRAILLTNGQFKSSIKTTAGANGPNVSGGMNVANVAVVDDEPKPAQINRDAEKRACLGNNIGIGNTFVWAAKDSNVANYATMVEDVEHPENNVCFVLVGVRSQDSRISTLDIQPRYFEWGQNITCGSWLDEAKMQARILDAKKSARVLGTVGGAVGGAGVGVGAMELFGNKLIGDAVQGQKSLDGAALYESQANVLKNKDSKQYDYFVGLVEQLKDFCGKSENANNQDCKKAQYADLIEWYDEYYKK